jgi:soluble lytic murein transglycosylase-like protein
MSLSLLKAARIVPALRAAAIVAACIVLQLSSSHAQTPAPEAAANPNEILTFEQMRVPRWLAETVVRAAQVTGVDPAYMMALADKESSLLPDNKARTSPQGGSAPASARRGPNASPSNRARPGA